MFGYAREEMIGQPVGLLIPERYRRVHARHRGSYFTEPRVRAMGSGLELYGMRRDHSEFPIEISLSPLATEDGILVSSAIRDISERKRLEDNVRARTHELSAALREREVLLQEVHHRVKNNLQVISSLINLQMRKLERGASRDSLEECQTRVQAIALIHEKLYQSRDYARVPFADYARTLVSIVFHATGISPGDIDLEMAIEDVAVPVDRAIPCGLLLNELITNALKHAFVDGRRGKVRVELRPIPPNGMRLVASRTTAAACRAASTSSAPNRSASSSSRRSPRSSTRTSSWRATTAPGSS